MPVVVWRVVFRALDLTRQEARPSGANGTRPMPSSRSTGMMSVSRLRSHSEYSLWQRRHRMHRVRLADVGDARLGQPEEPHLALVDQLGDRAGDVFHRHRGIDAVLVDEVDVIRAEAAQRALHRGTDRFGAAVPLDPDLLAALVAEAEFGGDDQSVALAFERLADQFLVLEGTVGLGRIQEGAAKLDGAMQRGDGLAFIRRTVGLAHRHAAETDRGDLQSLAA